MRVPLLMGDKIRRQKIWIRTGTITLPQIHRSRPSSGYTDRLLIPAASAKIHCQGVLRSTTVNLRKEGYEDERFPTNFARALNFH